MEPPKSDVPKLPDMVMCGDHPSFTKPELCVKEVKMVDKEKERAKERTASYARISPTASRTERGEGREGRGRATSDHALRVLEARRRAQGAELVQRPDADAAPANRALVQAALGSFRWPPYLLAVWVLVLVLTHVLHCLVNMLERALPALKKGCQYFRTWTEESWKGEAELNQRACPIALACATGALYAAYWCLCALLAVALWAVEPLCADLDDKRSAPDVEARVTDYVDDVGSKTDASIKQ